MIATTPERTPLLAPYSADHAASTVRRFESGRTPTSLSGYVRWARWAYLQEPPVRLHAAGLSDDGTPRWSGDFLAWVAGLDGACGEDHDGYLLTPFRCAIYGMHGRFGGSNRAAMAEFLLALASSDQSLDTVASAAGIQPPWVRPVVAHEALRRLWERYTPLR